MASTSSAGSGPTHPPAVLSAIETLLKEAMGLNVASIGTSSVLHAVQQRMAKRGIANIITYYHDLRSSPQEVTQLIETVVVPETWFFRAHHAFDALAHFAQEWTRKHPGETLRILSVPCSTGEEPYSIAMTLLTNQLKPAQFHIDAVDISARNIRTAQQGLYGKNSFRSENLLFRDRYFQPHGQVYKLSDDVMQTVNFGVANLLDANFSSRRMPYQVIFCRNLLIYFDRVTQQQAIESIDRMLTADGMLFLGHAEGGVVRHLLYGSVRYPMAFAFCRDSDERRHRDERRNEVQPGGKNPERRLRRDLRRLRPNTPAPAPFVSPEIVELPAPPNAPTGKQALSQALRLANEGHMVEAARLCEQYLQQHKPHPDAYYLLALVRDSAGEKLQAEELLRKAIYLAPAHYPSLLHLALLLDQRGETRQAGLFRTRAERAQPDNIDALLSAVP